MQCAIALLFCFLLILSIILVSRLCFYIVQVDGCSMMPHLESGDQVLVLRPWSRLFLRKGDIVLLKSWPEVPTQRAEFSIKRVSGLPGDTVLIYRVPLKLLEGIIDDHLYTYFASFDSPAAYVSYLIHHDDKAKIDRLSGVEAVEILKVPPNHLFVKGDWLLGGEDSITHGPVPFNKLAGSVVIRLS